MPIGIPCARCSLPNPVGHPHCACPVDVRNPMLEALLVPHPDPPPHSYTPAIINSASGALPSPPITACNDARLSAGQQAACLKCIGIKRRDACLKTTAATYWHADDQSCAWCGLGDCVHRDLL